MNSVQSESYGVAKDCTLALKVLQVRFIAPEKYEKEVMEKAYVRIMLDDDTYTSSFAKVQVHNPEDDLDDSELNQTNDSNSFE